MQKALGDSRGRICTKQETFRTKVPGGAGFLSSSAIASRARIATENKKPRLTSGRLCPGLDS